MVERALTIHRLKCQQNLSVIARRDSLDKDVKPVTILLKAQLLIDDSCTYDFFSLKNISSVRRMVSQLISMVVMRVATWNVFILVKVTLN